MRYRSRLVEIDFETYSEAGLVWDPPANRWLPINPSPPYGLSVVGAAKYAEHPSTEVLSLAYNMCDGAGPALWVPGLPDPLPLLSHIERGGLIQAQNCMFEYWIWRGCYGALGWPELKLVQLRDEQPRAFAWGLPGSLKGMTMALDMLVQKNKDGKRLIDKFSVPRNPTKKDSRKRLLPSEDPEDGAKFYGYNLDDIEVQSTASQLLPQLSESEHLVWELDKRINARGVYIDKKALDDCTAVFRACQEQYNAKLAGITDGVLTEASKHQAMKAWLEDTQGVLMPDMQSYTIDEVLEGGDLPPLARDVLEIRSVLGSASVKKLLSIGYRLTKDNRLHGLFAFCGASRTGRWAGRGPQPHNLYRDCPSPDAVETILEVMSHRDIGKLIAAGHTDPIKAICECLRGLFCAAPGHDLICADYSAIEAVVLAYLAGEQWRQDLFGRAEDIYSESAARITGIPVPTDGSAHPARKTIGKVAELASGYQGWVGAWKNFGAEEHFDTDDEIKRAILSWREASPKIVEMWGGQWRKNPNKWEFTPERYGVEGAAVSAILNPGRCYSHRMLHYGVKDDVLYCQLPSGRNLAYHKPRLTSGTDNYSKNPIWKISYMGHNSDYKKGPVGWMRLSTYGGKLTENATQAVARDILAHAMLALDAAGYPIVLHVHDEIVTEVPHGWGSVEEFEEIMSMMPLWCRDWPVRAVGGWRGRRYRKD